MVPWNPRSPPISATASTITIGTTFRIVQSQGMPHPRMLPKQHVYPNSPVSINLQHFICTFTEWRIHLGYTQVKVGQALAEVHGIGYHDTTICKFENLQLSYSNAQMLKPILEKWLEKAEKQGVIPDQQLPRWHLKQKTIMGIFSKELLEHQFDL